VKKRRVDKRGKIKIFSSWEISSSIFSLKKITPPDEKRGKKNSRGFFLQKNLFYEFFHLKWIIIFNMNLYSQTDLNLKIDSSKIFFRL